MPAVFPSNFNAEFAKYRPDVKDKDVRARQLKAVFAVSFVKHLKDKNLIRARFDGLKVADGRNNYKKKSDPNYTQFIRYRCTRKINGKDCPTQILVPIGIMNGEFITFEPNVHCHQRYSNESYKNGYLIEVNNLVNYCETLEKAGVNLLEVFEDGSLNVNLSSKEKLAFDHITSYRDVYLEHFKSYEDDTKNKYICYAKFHTKITKDLSLRNKIVGTRWIGETGKFKDRNPQNNRHEIGIRLVRKCEGGQIPTITVHSGLPKGHQKWCESLVLGCFHGSYTESTYQLANISLGQNYSFVNDDDYEDKKLAAFLFIRGLVKNEEWRIEPLTCVDFQSLYLEAAKQVDEKDAKLAQKDLELKEKDVEIAKLSKQLADLNVVPLKRKKA